MNPYPRFIALGLFFLTASVLSLELLQMRILSFMLWHHLAYMVISVVLLGLGAGGAFLAIRSERILARWDWWLVGSASAAGVTTVVAFVVLSRLELDTFQLTKSQYASLSAYYAILVVPYFFAGLTLAILFTRGIQQIGRIYFVDLIGSALGCCLFYFLIQPLGAPTALVMMAAGLGLAGLCFSMASSSRRLRLVSGGLVVALALSIPWSDQLIPTKAAGSKSLAFNLETTDGANLVLTQWTPMARIDVLEADESTNPFLRSAQPGDSMKMITVDGDANTWMFQHDDVRRGVPSPAPESLTSYHAAFLLKDRPDTLIIGPGGGNEIFTSQQMGSASVTGVELNAEMLDISHRRYADFTGYINTNHRGPRLLLGKGAATSSIQTGNSTLFKCLG